MRQKKNSKIKAILYFNKGDQGDLCDKINTQLKYRDFMTIYLK